MSGFRAALALLVVQVTTAVAQDIGQQGPPSLDLRTRLPGYGRAIDVDTLRSGVQVSAPAGKAYAALLRS